jgi:hypothetical protein
MIVFFITAFGPSRLRKKDIGMRKGVSASTSYNNNFAFSRWFYRKRKGVLREKQRSLGVNFFQNIFFTHGVMVDSYWEAKSMRYPF